MNRNVQMRLVAIVMLLIGINILKGAQVSTARGTIQGILVDADTKAPLIGANVTLKNTEWGTATDAEGKFSIRNIPVGNYTIKFMYIGYTSLVKTDNVVRQKRITFINCEMERASLSMESVIVSRGYFANIESDAVSVVTFSAEEIRRSPGTGGDISRIMFALPSVAKVNDQSNSLIVRGGSPMENAFYIDNIEIPNINHWPTQGASGGPIGLLNVDLIRDVNFYTGGFSADYGDRLSSVMDISFREGNRQEFDGQLDLNFSGFGGVFEGPIGINKGAWLLSLRRSYLDFLIKWVDIGTSIAPRYGDLQFKIVFDLNPRQKLTLLVVGGDDHTNSTADIASENDMLYYGKQDILGYTTGLNWRSLWNKCGYSNTSLSWTVTQFKEDFFETGTGIQLLKNNSDEQSIKLRNVNHFRFNHIGTIEFGLEYRRLYDEYRNRYQQSNDIFGQTAQVLIVNKDITADKVGVFFCWSRNLLERLRLRVGIRADYFSITDRWTYSPRVSVGYDLTHRSSFTISTGIFHQNLPLILLAQSSSHQSLKDPRAVHYIFGFTHLLTESTQLTIEFYRKDYRNFPLDPDQPLLFIVDELFYQYGFFIEHEILADEGRAQSKGIELMVQKKLAEDFYGIVGVSFFKTQYRDLAGDWRDRVYDNRIVMSIEGGYKPNQKWEFSGRWIFAGGVPYTPFDKELSIALNHGVFDQANINATRYPNYHSLNFRFDRRFHFTKTNLVFYFSVWNVYNRRNVASYYWNTADNRQDVMYQWSLLPIFGMEYEL